MTHTTQGMGAKKATPKRKAAGGYHTTTATTKIATQTIAALYDRTKSSMVRFASWLAVIFRGFL